MANLCDFASELGKPGSPVRKRWKDDKSIPSRLKVAKDFGLNPAEVAIVKQALEADDSKPVEDACAEEIQGLWVK